MKLIPLECNFSFDIKVLDLKVICGDITRLRRGFCSEEQRENEIWLTDYGEGNANIDLLTETDYYGKMLTGEIRQLKPNLCVKHT